MHRNRAPGTSGRSDSARWRRRRVEEVLPTGSTHVINTSFDSRGTFGPNNGGTSSSPAAGTLHEFLVSKHLAVPYSGQSKAALQALPEKDWNVLERS